MSVFRIFSPQDIKPARAASTQASDGDCPGRSLCTLSTSDPMPSLALRPWVRSLASAEEQVEGGPGLPPQPEAGLPPACPSSGHKCEHSPESLPSRSFPQPFPPLLVLHLQSPSPCPFYPTPASQDRSLAPGQIQPPSSSPSLAPVP